MEVALSVGVQKMVRSDKASAGVMFSIDTETGFKEMVVIDAAWGLGENVVQGSITPDEYRVFKPMLGKDDFKPIVEKTLGAKEKKMVYASGGKETTKNVDTPKEQRRKYTLNDEEILQLALWAAEIEKQYQKPMDMEWAKDGNTGEIFIVQARPETVQSQKQGASIKTYTLKEQKEPILTGLSIGDAIASGKAQKILSPDDRDRFNEDAILVTEMTDPDWVPIMKKAAGIITDRGGRTCHAAIVSRELGIPAVVGARNGVEKIEDGMDVTISCAQGDQGFVYTGQLDYEVEELSLENIPETKTRVMMNIASPAGALRWHRLPAQGIGLARMEFIINNFIKIHPLALKEFNTLENEKDREKIAEITRGYEDKSRYFVDKLSLGIAKIASSQYPEPVILRMSDFKTNEYADLIGGRQFEPDENNPMLGWRGASRYYSDSYKPGFGLECEAVKMVRDEMGLDNLVVMIPFCRTPEEADQVLEVMAEFGLKKGENGLEVYVMCEIPSNVILADQFAKRFDGFSIGSNDLTQLVLGVDRDSSQLAHLFDERSDAVKRMIAAVIEKAHENDCKVGICGQAPSDYPEFAKFLVRSGIDSISLNPDSVIRVKKLVSEVESEIS
jgi:pyruvate,water dikinase